MATTAARYDAPFIASVIIGTRAAPSVWAGGRLSTTASATNSFAFYDGADARPLRGLAWNLLGRGERPCALGRDPALCRNLLLNFSRPDVPLKFDLGLRPHADTDHRRTVTYTDLSHCTIIHIHPPRPAEINAAAPSLSGAGRHQPQVVRVASCRSKRRNMTARDHRSAAP